MITVQRNLINTLITSPISARLKWKNLLEVTRKTPLVEEFSDGIVEYIEQPLEVLKGVREVFIAAKIKRGTSVEYLFHTKEIKIWG